MSAENISKESLHFLQDQFRSYYTKNILSVPDRFSRREYAFVFFGGRGMFRHLAFYRKQYLQEFLRKKAPMHAYYSTAYYQHPDAPRMNEKEWMGAELIFDLDADHLPNAEKIPYEKQLELVKIEFIKLVDDFLMNDFGFPEESMDLFFSGGRGYHCHVKHPSIYQLSSGDRREIVDYITGRDLNESLVFHEESTGVAHIKGRTVSTGKRLKMPKPDEPGWKGRISQGLIDILNDILDSDDPLLKLKQYGVSEYTAQKLLEDLSSSRIERIKQGNLDQSKTIRRFFLNNALRKKAVSFAAGETDEPVTCDVKRLIRLPGSLHGKTGLKVSRVTLDTLDDYDPLTEAIAFDDSTVSVRMASDETITLNNETFTLSKGLVEVPLFLAMFLIGKKMANIATKQQ
jgi:DNA primase small subunit